VSFKIAYPRKYDDEHPAPARSINKLLAEEQKRKLVCHDCNEKRADTWLRNLDADPSYEYSEYLLCAKCRALYKIDRPKGYVRMKLFGSEFEAMPIEGEEGAGNQSNISSQPT
jgi:hypothetical protein